MEEWLGGTAVASLLELVQKLLETEVSIPISMIWSQCWAFKSNFGICGFPTAVWDRVLKKNI